MMFDEKKRVIVPSTPYSQDERFEWCKLNLDEPIMCHPITYGLDPSEIWYFETEVAATMFALRWGGTNGYY